MKSNRDILTSILENRFGVTCKWTSITDPDDSLPVEVLQISNVPSNRLVEVDRAAYDIAYQLFDYDWAFLIHVMEEKIN